ncbi:DUF2322 family protein [Undibacterium flavidum]|uniref:DUF2322 family protein n=1 Tax=Undibacterium flavidum TaxID=2762297 RepID=A0ABR6YGW5_9BURK|nr:DUF2322 family protein [Undibacterium flavidum]MBC3875752.1 DUF2322 family protein [Undibacterium flavidum]
MQFKEILDALANIDHLEAIEIYEGNDLKARIENKPGSAGSVKVYNALFQEFGEINAAAANKGLQIYAEHTADAIEFPGKHPNIDRLFALTQNHSPDEVKLSYTVKLIQK